MLKNYFKKVQPVQFKPLFACFTYATICALTNATVNARN